MRIWGFSDNAKNADQFLRASDGSIETDTDLNEQIDAMTTVIGEIHEAFQRDLLTPEQEQAYLEFCQRMGIIES
jgi:hypothetical protein